MSAVRLRQGRGLCPSKSHVELSLFLEARTAACFPDGLFPVDAKKSSRLFLDPLCPGIREGVAHVRWNVRGGTRSVSLQITCGTRFLFPGARTAACFPDSLFPVDAEK